MFPMVTWAFRKAAKSYPKGRKQHEEWKIQACETTCFPATKQKVVFSSRLSNPDHRWQGDGCSLPSVITHVVLQKRSILPSDSCLSYKSIKWTNRGRFEVMSQENKSWKRLRRWFSPRPCVASKKKHILLNARLGNCPAVTRPKSITEGTRNEEVLSV